MKPKQSKEYDHIDTELSKIYFNKHTANISPASQKKRTIFPIRSVILPIVLFFTIALIIFSTLAVINHFHKPIPEQPKTSSNTATQRSASSLPTNAAKARMPSGDKVLYNFETNTEGWEIPLWAEEKHDHVGKSLKQIRGTSSNGSGSLIMTADFQGNTWSAALAEISHYLDLDNYNSISVDIYIPRDCPKGLKAQIILTVGDSWRFVEMSRSFPLTPGEWTTITGDLSDKSSDWRRTTVDWNFRKDIRKIAVRIESNGKPAYSGSIYIDNIRVTGK